MIKKSFAHHLARIVIHTDLESAQNNFNDNGQVLGEFWVDEGECLSIAHEWSKEKRFKEGIDMLIAVASAFPNSFILDERLKKIKELQASYAVLDNNY